MLAGVKLWAFAHLLSNARLADVVLFGAFLVWAALAFRSARRRDRAAGTTYPAGPPTRDAAANREQFARTLAPLEHNAQLFWEYLTYGLALLGLLAVWLWRRRVGSADRARYRTILAEV